MFRKSHQVMALLTLTFGICASGFAQTRIGTVQGTVKDPQGALISGATVRITQPLTGYQQTTQTDSEGTFKLVNIPFNNYTVLVGARGFQVVERAADLHSIVPVILEITLAVATAAETVTVTAESGLVETDKTTSNTDISQTILERPLGAAPSRAIESMVSSALGFAPSAGPSFESPRDILYLRITGVVALIVSVFLFYSASGRLTAP